MEKEDVISDAVQAAEAPLRANVLTQLDTDPSCAPRWENKQ